MDMTQEKGSRSNYSFRNFRSMKPASENSAPSGNSTTQSTPLWILAGQVNERDPVREYQIQEFPFSIGRSSNSSLCLSESCVSKNHAELRVSSGRLIVHDLDSTNGTFVNGGKILGEAPVKNGDLLQFASLVFRVGVKGQITEHQTVHQHDNCDQALAMMQFDRLIDSGAFIPVYQPIVNMADLSVVGYEVLGRSKLFRMQSPEEMFAAALQLNLETQLSEMFRNRGIRAGIQLGQTNLFVNTHPKELGRSEFYDSLFGIRKFSDQQITLEIHERAVTDDSSMRRLCAVLKELDN